MSHNRSEYAVVTRCSDSDLRCSDARSDIVRDSDEPYAVVKESRCIVEEVEDPKKWLTNLRHYAIIVPHIRTVRESEASRYCSRANRDPMWNNHAFTVSTMAHGRGLNVVILRDFKYQTQILLSKKKIDTVVTRGIVQILLTFPTTQF